MDDEECYGIKGLWEDEIIKSLTEDSKNDSSDSSDMSDICSKGDIRLISDITPCCTGAPDIEESLQRDRTLDVIAEAETAMSLISQVLLESVSEVEQSPNQTGDS